MSQCDFQSTRLSHLCARVLPVVRIRHVIQLPDLYKQPVGASARNDEQACHYERLHPQLRHAFFRNMTMM